MDKETVTPIGYSVKRTRRVLGEEITDCLALDGLWYSEGSDGHFTRLFDAMSWYSKHREDGDGHVWIEDELGEKYKIK